MQAGSEHEVALGSQCNKFVPQPALAFGWISGCNKPFTFQRAAHRGVRREPVPCGVSNQTLDECLAGSSRSFQSSTVEA